MNKRSYLSLLAALFLAACGSSDEPPVIPDKNPDTAPVILTLTAPETCEQEQTCPVAFSVQKDGVFEGFSLSVSLLAGQARVSLGGQAVSLSGEWAAFCGTSGTLDITPTSAGLLRLILQAQTSDGELSAHQIVDIQVDAVTPIEAAACCEERLLNPSSEARVPIRLNIAKAGYMGSFSVLAATVQGHGTFYVNGQRLNGERVGVGEEAVFEFSPTTLGEYIFEFSVEAEKVSATARAYLRVIKQISITSPAAEFLTVTGGGEFDTEGEQATFSAGSLPGYGFEIDGWYDAEGQRLSASADLLLTITRECPSRLVVKARKRMVTITRNGSYRSEFNYLLPDWSSASVFDYRTEFAATANVAEDITFYYEESRYKRTIPPVEEYRMASPVFYKGNNTSSFLWRLDNSFSVSVRAADNPGMIFNNAEHVLESATTRYTLPADVAIQ